MTKEQIVEAMFQVLSERMNHSGLSKFYSDARFLEDIGLDSTMVLQLLMFMEVDHGLCIPEEALMDNDLNTVRDAAQLMYEGQGLPKVEKGLEVYDDIKVHCVVSSLTEIVKRFPELDHRIMYFGVADAETCVNDRYQLSYHDQNISHDFFFEWYEKLYGMNVTPWYDKRISKEENAKQLEKLVVNRTPDQHIMVMLDMFQLPERENAFNKDPFPHYVMLGPTNDPDLWFMYDPDYRWEGVFNKDRIVNAVCQPSVSGGYIFSDKGARISHAQDIGAYFDISMILDRNPVTDTVREIVQAHIEGKDKQGNKLPTSDLMKALEEVPVLSIRKYAYEHAFAYFWRELRLPEEEFEQWCDAIEQLVKTYKLIHFQAMKFSTTQNKEQAQRIFELLDQQDDREFSLKKRLVEVKQLWEENHLDNSRVEQLEGTEV